MMTIDTNDLLNSILGSLSRIDYIKPEEVPNIPLYMDQVTTFMDAQLASSKRYPEDKILTKTMINNYAKNDLLPPPLKKKYSKEHLLVLVFIYYFKSILSITDIQALLKPITDTYFPASEDLSLEDIYNEVFRLQKSQVDVLKEGYRQPLPVIPRDISGCSGERSGVFKNIFLYLSSEF